MSNQYSDLKRVAIVEVEELKAQLIKFEEVETYAKQLKSKDLDPSPQLIQLLGKVAGLRKRKNFAEDRVVEFQAAETLEAARLKAATGTSSHSFWQRNSFLFGVAGVTLGATVGPYCAMVLFTQVIRAAFAISSTLATVGLVIAAILLLVGIVALVNYFSNKNTPSLTGENDLAEPLQPNLY